MRPAFSRSPEPVDRYRISPSIRYRRMGDEAVVLCQSSAEILVLNEIGSRILHLVDGRRGAEDLCTALCEEFDVEAATVLQDLTAFLSELIEIGAVERVPSDS